MHKTAIYAVESGSLSGGVKNIYCHLNMLHDRGWHVEVYSLDQQRPQWFPLNPAIPWSVFSSYNHMIRVMSKRKAVKIATWWKTARPVAEASKPGEGFYLVADIETEYYSAPLDKELVKETYDLPLTQYTIAKWPLAQLPKAHYVGIGIDLNLYRPLDTPRQVNSVISVPRPQRLKGWSTHCEVYRKLYHAHKFSLYSFGVINAPLPYSNHVQSPTDEEVVKWYNRVGMFLSTSSREGFGLPHLEAMACGAIVITTDSTGVNEFCVNNENCLMVPVGDAQAMVDACLYALEEPQVIFDLQSAGFETAKNWGWGPVIDRLEALYENGVS